MGFSGGRWPAADKLQALMSIPQGCFYQPRNVCRYLWGGRDVQVFTLAFLPAHPTQMLVLTKNMEAKGGEDCPYQDGMQVLPVPKGQGGHVRIISHPHPLPPPRSVVFSLFCGAAAATTTFLPVSLFFTAYPSAAGHQVREMNGEDGAKVAPPLHLDQDGL